MSESLYSIEWSCISKFILIQQILSTQVINTSVLWFWNTEHWSKGKILLPKTSPNFSTEQKYIYFNFSLQDILKYTERAGLDTTALRKAYHVMMVVPKDANDMMQFGRLQGYDVSLK